MNLRYILDANVLMSILISGKSQYLNLLSLFDFYLPEFAFTEVNLYKAVILQKTKLDENQFKQFTFSIFSFLRFLPTFMLHDDSIILAKDLCENVDIKDVSYVSLAIDTGFPLLTRDEILFRGLWKQGFKKVELFETFLRRV